MGDFDVIRGKAPTKTELILEYLVNRANVILTPKEVAQGLGFNLQTTVTVLNRLALEGAISKTGRGKFSYDTKLTKVELKEKEIIASSMGVKEKPTQKIDSKTAKTIYKAIYDMANESTGDVIDSLTGLGPDDFNDEAPVESIQNLVRALVDILGREIADDIVEIALDSETKGEVNPELKRLLEA
jgi:hypothetical protein